MAYIGKQPVVGNFQVCDAISVVNGQAAYTMQVASANVEPENANHMLVSLNGVLQKPGSSFTISGATITFASNLATGDVIDFIILLGDTLNIGTPSDSTVSLAKLTATGTKDATTFLRGDNTFAAAGGGDMVKIATTTASSSSTINFDSSLITSDYKTIQITFNGLSVQNDGEDIYMAVSVDNGSNIISSISQRINAQMNDSGTFAINGGNTANGGVGNNGHLIGQDIEATSGGGGVSGILWLHDIQGTTEYKWGQSLTCVLNQNGNQYTYWNSSRHATTSAINYIRILNASGNNIDGGVINVYGFK